MFQTLRNAFKVKDIRSKIFYTFLMLVVVRLGSQLPIPGVDRSYFANWFSQQVGDAFNFFDAFTGGSFEEMSIFALNITPYITSSIIIELLTIAIPKLEEMQKDGEEGRKKLTAITRYVTVGLALLESIAMVIGFGRQGLIPDMTAMNVITVVVSLTAGSAFLMWVGERITEKGVGNGISIVLMINILSRVPSDITTLYETFIKPQTVAKGALAAVIISSGADISRISFQMPEKSLQDHLHSVRTACGNEVLPHPPADLPGTVLLSHQVWKHSHTDHKSHALPAWSTAD